jgi:hypothetical protein
MEPNSEPREKLGPPEPPADYFVVAAQPGVWYVSREMAKAIEASLNATPVPVWVTFVDLTGARVRVRTRLIEYVYHCTAEQRALGRAFRRARRAEYKEEPDWDEEE